MKENISLLLLIASSISLLSMVGCVESYMTVSDKSLRQIAKAGHDDAYNDVNDRYLWLSGGFCLGISGGCLLGTLGIVGAYFYQPSPPPMRLLGKPPEYIDVYVGYYKAAKNRIALSGACLGCAVGAIVAAVPRTPWAIPFGFFAGRIATERGW